jgi:hypothetical protein
MTALALFEGGDDVRRATGENKPDGDNYNSWSGTIIHRIERI